MRVLVTSTPGLGHIHPIVPLATALLAAGHEVVWATGQAACARVEQYGFRAVPAGLDQGPRLARTFALRPELRTLPPRDRRAVIYPAMFAGVAAPAMFADVRTWVDDARFRPDVIVHEPAELAAAPLATALGVANVTVGFGGLIPPAMLDAAADALAPLWSAAGAEPAPAAGLYDHLYLHPLPESLGEAPSAATVRRVRPDAFDGAGGAPAWIASLGRDRPCVYVTFGTEAGAPPPLALLLEALARLDVAGLVTTGPIDPTTIAAPANVRVERYVPQRAVLAHAAAIVSHGGSGAIIGAARVAVPQVCVPMAADQFDNADDLAATGVSITIEPADLTVDALVTAIDRAVYDPGLRASAVDLAAAFAELPDAASLVLAIEALTT